MSEAQPVAIHVDAAFGRVVWWARWKSRRGAGYAAADSWEELRKLLPRGKPVQLVDENDKPTNLVLVTTIGSFR